MEYKNKWISDKFYKSPYMGLVPAYFGVGWGVGVRVIDRNVLAINKLIQSMECFLIRKIIYSHFMLTICICTFISVHNFGHDQMNCIDIWFLNIFTPECIMLCDTISIISYIRINLFHEHIWIYVYVYGKDQHPASAQERHVTYIIIIHEYGYYCHIPLFIFMSRYSPN